MQFAEVIIDQKTKQWDATFTYAIDPAILGQLRVGSIVEVPFGQKTVEGVVAGFRRSLPNNFHGAIKSLRRILQAEVVLSKEELDLARALAEEYICSLSEAVFAILPPIPKKNILNLSVINSNPETRQGTIKLMLEREEKRFGNYTQIIEKNLLAKKSTWIIFADLWQMKKFQDYLGEELKSKSIYYSSDDNTTTRFKKWQLIHSGQAEVAIGSRMLILNRPTNVQTIIVDETSQSGHQEDQAPRYNTSWVAEFWQKRLGMEVLYGDTIPTLDQLVKAKQKKIHLISKKIVQSGCEIKLIDMAKEKRVVSLPLEEVIEKTIENKLTTAILVAKKGFGSISRCDGCGHVFVCPDCECPLTFFEARKKFICTVCGKARHELRCPDCRGELITTSGMALEKVSSWVKKMVADRYEVVNLDKENLLEDRPKKAIFVATQAIFRYPLKLDHSVVIDADFLLARPDFNITEKAFLTIFRLAAMTSGTLLLQTRNPELDFFQLIGGKHNQEFLQKLLRERFANGYPPYGELIKFESIDENENLAIERLKKVKEKIAALKIEGQLMGPAPAINAKERGKFKFVLILKTKKNFVRRQLRELNEKGLRIEFDAKSLL